MVSHFLFLLYYLLFILSTVIFKNYTIGQHGMLPLPLFSKCKTILYYIYFKNASYVLYASYMSNLLVTSYGACIDSTGTPQSITSTPLFARM